jgi:hypothetical protein
MKFKVNQLCKPDQMVGRRRVLCNSSPRSCVEMVPDSKTFSYKTHKMNREVKRYDPKFSSKHANPTNNSRFPKQVVPNKGERPRHTNESNYCQGPTWQFQNRAGRAADHIFRRGSPKKKNFTLDAWMTRPIFKAKIDYNAEKASGVQFVQHSQAVSASAWGLK